MGERLPHTLVCAALGVGQARTPLSARSHRGLEAVVAHVRVSDRAAIEDDVDELHRRDPTRRGRRRNDEGPLSRAWIELPMR